MNKKLVAFLVLLVIIGGGIFFKMKLRPPPPPEIAPSISVQEIQKFDGPDIVKLSNGELIKDLGYDIVLLSHTHFENGQSIFLFKSYSCRACEPNIRLWIYSTQTKLAEDFDFPGRHFVINGEGKDEEISDFESIAVSGECESSKRGIWIASRWRAVESDGSRPVASEQWENVKSVTVEFQNDGIYKVQSEPEDSISKFKQLISDKCHLIEGEDRHDYL